MPAAPEEFDAADALVREQFPDARLWEVPSWLGATRLAYWEPDASASQVDHLSEDGTVEISVRAVCGRSSARVLRGMHGQHHMRRGHARFDDARVGLPEIARAVAVSIDGHAVAARRWEDEGSWWLAADLADLTDSTAVVVHGAAEAPMTTELRTVTDVEPLLAARRRHLLRTHG